MQREATATRHLYVTTFWPWPQRMGARRRAAATVLALRALGEVDVLYFDQGWRNVWLDEAPEGVREAVTVLPVPTGAQPTGAQPTGGPAGRPPGSPAGAAASGPAGGAAGSAAGGPAGGEPAGEPEHPVPDPVEQVRRGGRRQAAAWLAEHDYDLVWCNRDVSWWAVRGLLRAPAVVDVDDLTDRLVLQQARAEGRAATAQTRREVAAWRWLQDRLKAEAQCLVVCSAADQERLGAEHSVVVPNVFLDGGTRTEGRPALLAGGPPAEPAGSRPGGGADGGLDGGPDGGGTAGVPRRPRILLQGDFTYRPNIVAAQRLVTGILPRVRQALPGAHVWLVGRHTGALDPLAGPDVAVFGQVRDMAAFVSAADVVAVPLTEGSGTRIKILEAWQLARPVVSTSQGAEGLAAEPGRHLLLAESDAEFAAALVAVATRPELAARLVAAGKALVAERHGYPALLAGVTAAVATALGREVHA